MLANNEEITLRVGGDGSEASSMFKSLAGAGAGGLLSLANPIGIITAAVAGLSTAFLGIATYGVVSATDVKKSLNSLQTQAGLTDNEMVGLKQTLLDIYEDNYGDSYEDIANALAIVKKNTEALGLTSDEMIKSFTEKAFVLRDTFEYDVNDSVNSATSLVNNFGLTADEAFELIAQGAQQGLDANGDMLDILNEYSPQFKSLGFSAEDMFGVLKSGVDNGVFSLDELADAMKEFNIKAIDGSKTTAEGFEMIGMDADKMAKKFASGGDTAKNAFYDVVNAVANIKDPIKQNQAAIDLFGTKIEDMEAGVIPVLQNVGGEFDKNKDTMSEIDDIKYDDFFSVLEGLKRMFDVNIAVPLGDFILPILGDLMGAFQEIVHQLRASFGPVLDQMKDSVKKTFGDTQVDILGFVDLILQNIPKIAAFFTENLLPIWNEFVKIVKNVVTTFVVDFGPKVFDLIKDKGPSIVTAIKNVTSVVLKLYKGFREFTESGLFKKIIGYFSNVAVKAIDSVTGIIKTVILFQNKIYEVMLAVQNFNKKVRDAFVSLKNSAISVFDSMKSGISSRVSSIYNTVKSKFESAKTTAVNAFKNLYNGVKSKIDSVKTSVSGAVDKIKSLLSGISKSAYNWGANILKEFINGIKSKISSLSSTLSGAANKVKDFLGFSSPTKEGPGKTADKWAPSFMKMFISGLDKWKPKLTATMGGIASSINLGSSEPNRLYNQSEVLNNYTPTNQGLTVQVIEPNVYDDRGVNMLLDKIVNKLDRYGIKPTRR